MTVVDEMIMVMAPLALSLALPLVVVLGLLESAAAVVCAAFPVQASAADEAVTPAQLG